MNLANHYHAAADADAWLRRSGRRLPRRQLAAHRRWIGRAVRHAGGVESLCFRTLAVVSRLGLVAHEAILSDALARASGVECPLRRAARMLGEVHEINNEVLNDIRRSISKDSKNGGSL